MELDDLILQKLKQVELNILKTFIGVCEKLDLKYYVIDGTLLGAVRHKGFIPWDDDIDVGMMRKDYEIFLEKGQALLPDYYFIQTRNTDPNYPMFFAKIRDSRTTFVESAVKNIKMNHGVYIDIFPLDYYPENKIKGKWIEFKKKILLARKMESYSIDNRSKVSITKSYAKKILCFLSKIFYPTINSAFISWNKLYLNINHSNLITNHGGAYYQKAVMPFIFFNNVVKLDFENIQVNAPAEYDKYLTKIYGNYMKFPPIENQIPHHNTEIIDLEKSYLEHFAN